jgi:Peptidase family C50
LNLVKYSSKDHEQTKIPSVCLVSPMSTDKDIADVLDGIAFESESFLVQAVCLQLALEILPWPSADPEKIMKWKHSSRLPKCINRAIRLGHALIKMGFKQAGDWFIDQAKIRADLGKSFLPSNITNCNFPDPNIYQQHNSSITKSVASCNVDQLKRDISRVLASHRETEHEEIIAQIFPYCVSPEVYFVSTFRRIQRKLDKIPTNIEKLHFLQNLKCEDFLFKRGVKIPCKLWIYWLDVSKNSNCVYLIRGNNPIKCFENTGDKILNLMKDFDALIEENKQDIKENKNSNVEEFWNTRKSFDSKIRLLLCKVELLIGETVTGDNDEIIQLSLPMEFNNFPFESMEMFKNKKVARIVHVHKIEDERGSEQFEKIAVLNPEGDLLHTDQTLRPVLDKHGFKHFSPVPEILEISSEMFVYAGHCGGEKYWNGALIQKSLGIKDFVLLLGCRTGMSHRGVWPVPFHYLIGGSSIGVIGVLWDVLNRDCDRYSEKVIDLIAKDKRLNYSLVLDDMLEAKKSVKFKYLTGSAFILYKPLYS